MIAEDHPLAAAAADAVRAADRDLVAAYTRLSERIESDAMLRERFIAWGCATGWWTPTTWGAENGLWEHLIRAAIRAADQHEAAMDR